MEKTYVAGWNMPGYLPDDVCDGFDTIDEAVEYLKQAAIEACQFEGKYDDEDVINVWKAEGDSFQAEIGGFVYFANVMSFE